MESPAAFMLLGFLASAALSAYAYHLLLKHWIRVPGLKPKHSIQLGMITALARQVATALAANTILILPLHLAIIVGLGSFIRYWFSLTPGQGLAISAGAFAIAWIIPVLALGFLVAAMPR